MATKGNCDGIDVNARVGADVGASIGDEVGVCVGDDVIASVGEEVGVDFGDQFTGHPFAAIELASEFVDLSKPSEGTTLRTVDEGAPKSKGLMHAHAKDPQSRPRRGRSQWLETAVPSHHHSDRRTSVRLPKADD